MSVKRLVMAEKQLYLQWSQTFIQNSRVSCVIFLCVCCTENFLNNLCLTLFLGSLVKFENVIFFVNCEIFNYGVICALVSSDSSLKLIFSATEIARGWSSCLQSTLLQLRNVINTDNFYDIAVNSCAIFYWGMKSVYSSAPAEANALWPAEQAD